MEKKGTLHRSWFTLFLRLFLFIGIQSLFALGFLLNGKTNAWELSANWWPIVVGLSNLVCLLILVNFFKSEGRNYWDMFRFRKDTVKQDLLLLLGFLVLAAPISYLPNVMLGKYLFGDASATLELFIRPLPPWAVIVSLIVFPVTQGLAEIPAYMMYVMPGFIKAGYPKWLSVLLPVLLLSAQHIAVPLLFDVRFIIWRLFMYLPFALLIALVIRWRPRMLPYIAIIHILMDVATVVMLFPSVNLGL